MNKIKRLEKMRYSILTDDLSRCYICHAPKSDIHEVYEGARRIASMKYGCCLPVCRSCHNVLHNNYALNEKCIPFCSCRYYIM